MGSRDNLSPGARFAMKTKNKNELAVNEIETREASESHARTARFDNQLLFIYFTWRNNASIIQFPPEKKVHLSPLVFEFFFQIFNFAAKF